MVLLSVLNTVAVVSDSESLVVSNEGSLAEVGSATSPFSSTLRRVGATTAPSSELDLHGSLGESSAALSIGVLQLTNLVAIDVPANVVLGPVEGVGVVVVLGVRDRVVSTTVVGRGISLSEVITLHLSLVASNPLPVNLVKIVGLQHETGDDTSARCGFNN